MSLHALALREARADGAALLILKVPLQRAYLWALALAMAFGGWTNISIMGASYRLTAAEIVLAAGCPLAIVTAWAKGYVRLLPGNVKLVSWVLVALWSLSAVLWAPDPLQSVAGALAVFEGLLAYLIAVNLPGHDRVSLATPLRLLCLGLTAQLVATMGPQLLTGQLSESFYALKEQVVTPMGASNYIAVYLGFGLLYELSARRLLWPVFAAVAGAGLMLTLSRAGLLVTGLVAGSLLLTVVWRGGARSAALCLMMGGLVVLLLLATPLGGLAISQLRRLPRLASALTRMQLWSEVWRDFIQAPLLGHGLGWRRDPHNAYLQALHDLGMIGTVFFATLLLAPIGRIRRSGAAEAVAILFGYVTMLLHFSVEAGFFGSLSQIWLGTVLAHLALTAAPDGDDQGAGSALAYEGREGT